MNRNAWTERNCFWETDGVCMNNEVSLSWKDNHGRLVSERVALDHLLPAPPKSKGDLVIILSGPHQNSRGKVVQYRRKKQEADVELTSVCIVQHEGENITESVSLPTPVTFPLSQICRYTLTV